MNEGTFEHRLSSALKCLSARVVSDVTPDDVKLMNWDSFAEGRTPDLGEGRNAKLTRSTRTRRGMRALTAVGFTFGLIGIGTGIAAAAGVFTTVGVALIAPARGSLSPTGHWSATNVVTRISEPGPDRSTITLQTSSSDATNGCFHLMVAGPTEPPPGPTEPSVPGIVSCGEVFNSANPPQTTTPSQTFVGQRGAQPWRTPTGSTYVISYGEAPAGTASAKLINESTGRVVTADVPLTGRFYAYPLPQSRTHPLDELAFYNATGAQIGTSAL